MTPALYDSLSLVASSFLYLPGWNILAKNPDCAVFSSSCAASFCFVTMAISTSIFAFSFSASAIASFVCRSASRVTLSPEINYDNLDNLIKDKVELLVYGKVELMLTKSCPIKEVNMCPCNKEDIYYLEDINKNKYRILHSNCLTHIMHYKNIDYLDKIDYYKSIGIKSFRLELLDEDYNDTIKLINNIKNK